MIDSQFNKKKNVYKSKQILYNKVEQTKQQSTKHSPAASNNGNADDDDGVSMRIKKKEEDEKYEQEEIGEAGEKKRRNRRETRTESREAVIGKLNENCDFPLLRIVQIQRTLK